MSKFSVNCIMSKQESPLFKGFSGSVNRQLVFKQVHNQTIVSSFPDRSQVIYSEQQKQAQKKFSDAVAFAKAVICNVELKKIYSIKAGLYHFRTAWNAAIAEYMGDKPLCLKPQKQRFKKSAITDKFCKSVKIKLVKYIPIKLHQLRIINRKSSSIRRKGSMLRQKTDTIHKD